MSNSDTILSALADGVLTLTLNRPDKLNAFNDEMHLALRAGFEQAHADDAVRAVLLTGSGRGFCAGQDLGDRDPKKGVPDLGHTIETFYNPLLRLIRSLEKPVICAVNGVAAGAGANLALACDIVLAAKSASFIEAFSKLGLIPDTGGTWALPRLIGPARAMGLAMLGERLPAEKAEEWGLIWRCVPDDALMLEAMAMAEHFAAAPTKGLAYTKKAMLASSTNTLEQQLALEASMMRELGYSHDYREGVAAFIDKRQPQFQGN